MTFDAYLAPLLGAVSPGFWGFAAHRAFGAVLFNLGRTIWGTRLGAAELIHLFPGESVWSEWQLPQVTAEVCSQAIEWWVGRLNDLFAVISDPAVFTDAANVYQPSKHLQAMLNIEQLFRRVAAIQKTTRDAQARKVLLFTVLDTLERLTNIQLDRNCTLSHAQKILDQLAGVIPAAAGRLLLPQAAEAVKSLRRLQDGFFLKSASQHQPGGYEVNGASLEAATAAYIKVLRDATHGHGGKTAEAQKKASIFLASHNGYMEPDVPLLGYLYLLDLLVNPDRLRAILRKDSRRR